MTLGSPSSIMASCKHVIKPLLFGQPCRYRFMPDPGTLEQRLFKAISTPVIPTIPKDKVEQRIRRKIEKEERLKNNPYKIFLENHVKTNFYYQSRDRMIIVLQPLYHKHRDFVAVRNQLFTKNLIFHTFPVRILRSAATNTPWETFAQYFLSTDCPNFYLFGDATPEQCADALRILRQAPFLLVLGGLVEYRVMTPEQLQQYAESRMCRDLPTARSRLLGVLEQPGQSLISTVTRKQSDLLWGLKQLDSATLNK